MLIQPQHQHHQQVISHTTIMPKTMRIHDNNQILNPHIIMEAIYIFVRNRIYLQ